MAVTVIIILAIIGLFLVYKLGGFISRGLLNRFSQDDPIQKLTAEQLTGMQDLFFKTVFLVLGHIAKIDGCISDVEVKLTQTYMEKMGLSAQHKRDAIELFRQGSKPNFDLQDTLDSFKKLAERDPKLTEILLVYIVNLARIDGLFVETEMIVVDEVATGLAFSSIAFEHLVRMISSQNRFSEANKNKSQRSKAQGDTKDYQDQNNDLAAAYDALGVSANASNDDIKKAYRKLMSQYHPDKLAGQGIPEFMIKAATERAQKIQGAYSYVKKYRG